MVGETSAVSGWLFKGATWGSCGGRSREVVPAPAGFRAKPRGCEGAKEGGGGATRMAFVEEHPAPQRLRGRSHPTGFPTSPNDLPQRRWDAGKPIKPRILCAPAPLREIIPPPHRVLPPAGCSRRDAGTQGNPSNHGSPASLRPCGKILRLTAGWGETPSSRCQGVAGGRNTAFNRAISPGPTRQPPSRNHECDQAKARGKGGRHWAEHRKPKLGGAAVTFENGYRRERGRLQPQGGDLRQPGAAPRGSVTAWSLSPERAA